MEGFTNEVLDTANLPRFEEVPLTELNRAYAKVVVIQTTLVSLIFLGIAVASAIWIEPYRPYRIWGFSGVIALIGLVSLFTGLSFKKKGYAFREHDVIYRSGVIATNTMIVPYNRIQHVALHEGVFSRIFGLATVQVFTAGGHQSDIEIPGIEKERAEDIKQLLMGKIQNPL